VSVVFKFLSLDVTGLYGQAGMEPFEGPNAGHLIGTGHMGTHRGQCGGGLIHLTHRADLLGQFEWIVGGWGEPIPFTMGL
jgi:hypothetical protein